MQIHRIIAIFLRHLYPLRRDFDIWTDMAYWPLIDTIMWGVTSQWLGESAGVSKAVVSILTALVLWNIIWRSQSEVSRNLIDEIWNNNLVNLFATPLTLAEWITAVVTLSFFKTAITMLILIPGVFLLYSVNVFAIGWWLIPFYFCMAMTGWWVGFISSGIVIRWGPRVQSIVWTLPAVLLPLSAVFFPLSQLPIWLRPVSLALPPTYIFESMRSLITTGSFPLINLAISLGLNVALLGVTVIWFIFQFRKSVELGLSRFD